MSLDNFKLAGQNLLDTLEVQFPYSTEEMKDASNPEKESTGIVTAMDVFVKGMVLPQATQLDRMNWDLSTKQQMDEKIYECKSLKEAWIPRVPQVAPWEGLDPMTFKLLDDLGSQRSVPSIIVARNLHRRREQGLYPISADWDDSQTNGEVTVGLAGYQLRVRPGIGPEVSVVSMDLWREYQRQAKARGDLMIDYEHYQKMSQRQKAKQRRIVFVNGRVIQTHGPYKCQIEIGPNPVTIDVFLTGDATFGHRFILGQDAWGALAIKTVAGMRRDAQGNEKKDSYNEAHVRMCKTGDEGKDVQDTSRYWCRTQRHVKRGIFEHGI